MTDGASSIIDIDKAAELNRMKRFAKALADQQTHRLHAPRDSRERKLQLIKLAKPHAEVALDARLTERPMADESWLRELAMVAWRLATGTKLKWLYAFKIRGSSKDKRRDIFCRFCGEFLRSVTLGSFKDWNGSRFNGDEFDLLRGARRGHAVDIDAGTYGHTTVCALRCLAGQQPYETSSYVKLPSEFRAQPQAMSFDDARNEA